MMYCSSDKVNAKSYSLAAIDAEWYQPAVSVQSHPTYLTKQVTFFNLGVDSITLTPQLTIVLWDKNRALPLKFPKLNHQLLVIPCDVHNTTLFDVAELYQGDAKNPLQLLMFYSPKDVEATIGRDAWKAHLIAQPSRINKLRNLTGSFEEQGTYFKLKDCFGAFNSALDKAFESVGMLPIGKGLDKQYQAKKMQQGESWNKGMMDVWMDEEPDDFLTYAVGDTADLGELLQRRIEQVNTIIQDALGRDIKIFDFNDFPMSSGALVSKTFVNWLMMQYQDLYRATLTLTDANDNKAWKAIRELRQKVRDEVISLEVLNQEVKSNFVHGLSMGGIRNFILLSQNTGLFGAMVQGGRCINEDPKENPYEQYIQNVIDIDLSSCYGSALRNFEYPFGIPTIFDRAIDDKEITLGDFLKSNRAELVDGLWTIVVSGHLSFEQDLVHSKYNLSTKSIMKALINEDFSDSSENPDIYGRDIETAHLGGNFVLTRKQIENGIVTSDNLKVILAVTDNNELKEIYNLKVVTATYYPKSKRVSHEQLTSLLMSEKTAGKKTANGDFRCKNWTTISLSEFVGKFIDYRQSLKTQAKQHPKGSEKYNYYNLLQNSVKLFVNTVYGCLAAPYFPMGNTVLANNITCKARTGVWMLSKALLTVQSITDGGMFSNDLVAVLAGNKKPGLNALSDRSRMLAHRSIKTKRLVERDIVEWMSDRSDSDEKQLDAIATDHINAFWGHYGLSLPFNIECKYDNTAKQAVYFGSSDYLLIGVVDKRATERDGIRYVIKVRGAKEEAHPKKQILWHLMFPEIYPVPAPKFEYDERVGVTDYQTNTTRYDAMDLLPGDDEHKVMYHKPYSPGRHFVDEADWKRYESTKSKAEQRYNKQPGDLYGISKKLSEGVFKHRKSK